MAARSTCKHLVDTLIVQFRRDGLATVVTLPRRDSQASASDLVRRNQREHQEGLSYASFREAKISKDRRPTSIAQLAL